MPKIETKGVTLNVREGGAGFPLVLVHGWSESSYCWERVMPHLLQRANFAVTARAELGKLRDWAGARGWGNLRLLSTQDNNFTSDFGMEVGEDQLGGVSVFRKDADETVGHFYTGGMLIGEGEKRGLDLLSPVWHFFALLPEGRGD